MIKIIIVLLLIFIILNLKTKEKFSNKKIDNIRWSQIGRKVYLHINEDKFYFIAPKNFLIKNVSEEKKKFSHRYY